MTDFPSTMQDVPITVRTLFDQGRTVFADTTVTTYRADRLVPGRATFAEIAGQADAVAAGLAGLGLRPGDRVATLLWNQAEHLVTYFAVTCGGWVLHPLNPRLSAAQLADIVRAAGDVVLIVDESLLGLWARISDHGAEIPHRVVVAARAPADMTTFADLAATPPTGAWPELSEAAPAVLCYTSGTSGAPKGVVYSHRAIFLQTQSICTANVYGIGAGDCVLVSVPIYHTNAASLHLGAWSAGARIVLPDQGLRPATMAAMIGGERVTVAVGVVTLWNDLLGRWSHELADLSSLRLVVSGGSAPPAALIAGYRDRGVPLIQGWGMTESLGICAMGHPPPDADGDRLRDYLGRAGRIVTGIEARIVDVESGRILPWDGVSTGELQVRGPWVTAFYLGQDPVAGQWFATGDIGTVSADGYVRITDRLKDVIKSGGEWIASLELEAAIRVDPQVAEVAVIGIADERWQERPLAVLVPAGDRIDLELLRDGLSERVARWWIPEKWCVVAGLPRTSVGKVDKVRLRARYADGDLIPLPAASHDVSTETVLSRLS